MALAAAARARQGGLTRLLACGRWRAGLAASAPDGSQAAPPGAAAPPRAAAPPTPPTPPPPPPPPRPPRPLSAPPGFGAARALGFAGALPFWALSPPVAAALSGGAVGAGAAAAAQLAYGAAILSFLGGVHWGLAMVDAGGPAAARAAGARYAWAVTPALMAWPTTLLGPEAGAGAAGLQAALLALCYAADAAWARAGLLPRWYVARLRAPLTAAAAGGLALTAAAGALGG